MGKKEERKITVTHILADGTQVDSIDGHIIPAGNQFYNVMLAIVEMGKRNSESKSA